MTRRWRNNGDDWTTGCQTVRGRRRKNVGSGGVVWLLFDGGFFANAWTTTREIAFAREFRNLRSAQAAVERWLARWAPKKDRP